MKSGTLIVWSNDIVSLVLGRAEWSDTHVQTLFVTNGTTNLGNVFVHTGDSPNSTIDTIIKP